MSTAWMPLYIGDYLADTGALTAEEHGAYLLLIMHCWQQRSLPAQDSKLRAIARVSRHRWIRVRKAILPYFQVGEDGTLTSRRVMTELAKRDEITAARKRGGEASGRSRSTKFVHRTRKNPSENNGGGSTHVRTDADEANRIQKLGSSSGESANDINGGGSTHAHTVTEEKKERKIHSLRVVFTSSAREEGKPPAKAHPLPADFEPSETTLTVAYDRGMDDATLSAEIAKFRDHYEATGRLLVDWNAALRKWLRMARLERKSHRQKMWEESDNARAELRAWIEAHADDEETGHRPRGSPEWRLSLAARNERLHDGACKLVG